MAIHNDETPLHEEAHLDKPDLQVQEQATDNHQHPQEEALNAAAAPKPGPQHNRLSEDQKKALDIHNKARHDVPNHPRKNLIWDPKLAAAATAYAKKLAHDNAGLKHSSGDQRPNQGENLAWSKPHGSFADASKMWVDERKNYHGQKIGEGDFGSYGHYTQVCGFCDLSSGW
ncbi:MAG: hypothetical protein Q9219_007054 [cf. Caloplaca sp. 3 TL-2023]